MTRRAAPLLLLSLTVAVTPSALFGKAETARVTISGGGLARPIDITDARVLEMSHAWGSQFLDASRPPLTQAPDLEGWYEVTIYSEIAANDIRKTCVFFYSAGSAAGRGIVYLPNQGALWLLNAGTIMRAGRDGKWSYASPAWETLIKPFIAAALAAHDPSAAITPEVVVDHWTKPKPGWLYVLDPRSDPANVASQIWLVDPETGRIAGNIRVGYHPDFTLSPDGSRLYIASGERESGDLAVLETNTGAIRYIPFPNRVLYKPWYQGLPPFSEMALAPDGRALWISGHNVLSPDRIEPRLFVFDAKGEKFRAASTDNSDCDYGDFVAPAKNRLEFWCGSYKNSSQARILPLDGGGASPGYSVDLPAARQCGLAEAVLLPDGARTAMVRTDGAVYKMDLATRKFSATPATGACREWLVAHAQWPYSAGGAKLYIGYGGVAPNGMSAARELRVFNTETWAESGRIETSAPFWRAAVSPDGKYIYTTVPERNGIIVIDGDSLVEKRFLAVGNTPSLVIVAP